MIKIKDNRKSNERQLYTVEVGDFFLINDILYRRCWWVTETFDRIDYEDDCFICMRIDDGELVAVRYDTYVEPVANRQVEVSLED